MRLLSDALLTSPETERLCGSTSIPSLVDHLMLKPTRFSGHSVIAPWRSPGQKPQLELEYPLKPGQAGASCHSVRERFWAFSQPQSQKSRQICHGDWQVLVEPLWCFLIGGIGHARISSEPMPLKRAARAAPLPSHRHRLSHNPRKTFPKCELPYTSRPIPE